MKYIVWRGPGLSLWQKVLNLQSYVLEFFDPSGQIAYLPSSREVDWDDYLQLLSEEDRGHVREFARRTRAFAREHDLSLALMAVGSVLNKRPGTYGDVDLVLLPVDYSNCLTEKLLSLYVCGQEEICSDDAGKPIVGKWEDIYLYERCWHWHLFFGSGKTLNVFVCRSGWYETLLDKLVMEVTDLEGAGRKFAYRVFGDLDI